MLVNIDLPTHWEILPEIGTRCLCRVEEPRVYNFESQKSSVSIGNMGEDLLVERGQCASVERHTDRYSSTWVNYPEDCIRNSLSTRLPREKLYQVKTDQEVRT